mgnify:CR=1 FL=1
MGAVGTKNRSIIVAVAKLAALILISTQVTAQSVVENIKPVGQVCLTDQPCVGTLIDDASSPIISTSAVTVTKEEISSFEEPTNTVAQTEHQTPKTFDAASTYQMSCFACHGTGAAGAPLLGEVEVWEEILAKGIEVVMANVINGLNAMPARGLCASCSDDDLKSLVDYMISQ